MQNSVFIYNPKRLVVPSFTGTGTEFANVSAGLAEVWQVVSNGLGGSSRELSNLMYISGSDSFMAVLSNGTCHTVCGVNFQEEFSLYNVGSQLLDKIQQVAG